MTLPQARRRQPARAAAPVGLVLLVALGACAQTQPPANADLSLAARLRLAEAIDQAAGGGRATLEVLRAETVRAPQDPTAWERLAAFHDRLGQPGEAAEALRRAIAIRGATLPAMIALGRLELRTGNGPGAVEAFEQARRLSPGSPEAHGGLGLAYDLIGAHEAAQSSYRQALALVPGNWTHRANLSMSYLMSGQPPRAVEPVAEAEWNMAAPRPARHNLGLALAAMGERERVVRLLRTEMGPVDAQLMAEQMRVFAAWLVGTAPAAASQSGIVPGFPGTTPPPQTTRQGGFTPPPAPTTGLSGFSPPPIPGAPPGPVIFMEPIPDRPAAPPTPRVSAPPRSPTPAATPPRPPESPATPRPEPPAEPVYRAPSVEAPAREGLIQVAGPVPAALPGSLAAGEAERPAPRPALVQHAAAASERLAHLEWARLTARHPSLFEGVVPTVTRLERNGQVLFRLRSVIADDAAAQGLCARLRAAGEDCFVDVRG